MTAARDVAAEVRAFCHDIGTDPLLVQGAGGNVSWKDGDILWVKASGTWLADAGRRDIFVPVDLAQLRAAVGLAQFEAPPVVRGELAAPALRPSIETMLHALMPHAVVAHVHAVDVLAYLVCEDFEARLRPLLPDDPPYVAVGYHKPGAALAQAVHLALGSAPAASVVLMQNHGVVVGGPDVATVHQRLLALAHACLHAPGPAPQGAAPVPESLSCGGEVFNRVSSPDLNQLATEPGLYNRLGTAWALYPDHVVFLGPQAACFDQAAEAQRQLAGAERLPKVVFLRDRGVFVHEESPALLAQLRCYLDVLCRLPPDAPVRTLDVREVAALLNWDAEAYRKRLARP